MCARLLLAFGITLSLQAQQDPSDLLQQVRAKVADTLDRLPRYLCTQTIDRSVYQPSTPPHGNYCDHPPNTHLTTHDRLRLDVATTSKGEIYSWVGASRFSDRELVDMIQDGAISTGSFANLLSAIFRGNAASFTRKGSPRRGLVELGFQVPYEKSAYTHGDRQHRVIAGYDGSFLVDTKTGDLVRLAVRTDRLPPDTGACCSTTALSYTRVRLKDADFLLPTESRLTILSLDGSKSENRTVFSGCHEFLGESAVKFDPPPQDSPQPDPAAQPIVILPGLPFSVVLTQEIRMATAAVGDSIQAKLVTPIQGSAKVLVPAGATVTARLVRLRQYYGRQSVVSLAFQLQTVDVGGVSLPLLATPDTGKSFPKKSKDIRPSVELGPLSALENRAVTYNLGYDHSPYRIPVALKSNWVTASP
jgi:hypothetical protein